MFRSKKSSAAKMKDFMLNFDEKVVRQSPEQMKAVLTAFTNTVGKHLNKKGKK